MRLPVNPPLEPMLATPVPQIPRDVGMTYEPKWDGFRCLIFRDGDEVELASRGGKTLTRYFPEVIEQARAQLPERIVVDCEIVVIRRDTGGLPRLDFELLSQRIHPAAKRINQLAAETPAEVVAFDLLAIGDDDLMAEPFSRRRAALAHALAGVRPPIHLTPVTTDPDIAQEWFTVLEGAGLDGLIAKPGDEPYVPGKRLMLKVKHARTADVVVAGFRPHAKNEGIGSLLLGLYDDDRVLHHIGVASGFSAARALELLGEVAEVRDPADHPWLSPVDGQRVPGAPSRWTKSKDPDWQPLNPVLVAEVAYDAMEGPRLRHTARFQRWRPDREAGSCGYDQLERPIREDVEKFLAAAQ